MTSQNEKNRVAGGNLTKVVVIQSLENSEVKTGSIISDQIRQFSQEFGVNLPVEILDCDNKVQFIQILNLLKKEATFQNHRPVLHIECHGHPIDGLEFSNGSTISWSILSEELRQLNSATKFNLLAIFSACFGGYFLSQITPLSRSPCWATLAPTDTVDPGEIMAGFRKFYKTFFQHQDVGIAIAETNKLPLTTGVWFGTSAERWYERVVNDYVKTHCSKEKSRERAKRLYRQLQKEGITRSIGSIERLIQRQNRMSLIESYFNRYFLLENIPENIERFQPVRQRVIVALNNFRSEKNFVI